jgi:hypothetical protein
LESLAVGTLATAAKIFELVNSGSVDQQFTFETCT